MEQPPVIVSACLLGLHTRYDGGSAPSKEAMGLLQGRQFIPVCPEQLGGLPTPRPRALLRPQCGGADVINGKARVIDDTGADITGKLVKGAQEVLKIAQMCGAREAFLKEKSPSCGVNTHYRDGKIVAAEGVTTAQLRITGLSVKGF